MKRLVDRNPNYESRLPANAYLPREGLANHSQSRYGLETWQTSKWLTNELRFMLNCTLHRAHPLF